jgi:transposase-like protein
MTESKKRKFHAPEFKSKVGLEALGGMKTVNQIEIAQEYGVHRVQVGQWKREIRHGWIGAHADLTQKRQCMLAGVSRTTVYAKRKAVVVIEIDEVLKRLIDEEYTQHPFYGS